MNEKKLIFLFCNEIAKILIFLVNSSKRRKNMPFFEILPHSIKFLIPQISNVEYFFCNIEIRYNKIKLVNLKNVFMSIRSFISFELAGYFHGIS